MNWNEGGKRRGPRGASAAPRGLPRRGQVRGRRGRGRAMGRTGGKIRASDRSGRIGAGPPRMATMPRPGQARRPAPRAPRPSPPPCPAPRLNGPLPAAAEDDAPQRGALGEHARGGGPRVTPHILHRDDDLRRKGSGGEGGRARPRNGASVGEREASSERIGSMREGRRHPLQRRWDGAGGRSFQALHYFKFVGADAPLPWCLATLGTSSPDIAHGGEGRPLSARGGRRKCFTPGPFHFFDKAVADSPVSFLF